MTQIKVYSAGEAAQELGLKRAQLLHFIESGKLPSPSLQVPGRRLFTVDDIERMRQSLAEMSSRSRTFRGRG